MASGGQVSPKSGGHSGKPGNSPKDGVKNTVTSPVPSVTKSPGNEKPPSMPGEFPSLPPSPEDHPAQIASIRAPAKFVLQSPPAVTARQAAGEDTASKASESTTDHEPKGMSKEVKAGASSRKQPQNQLAQSSPGEQPSRRRRRPGRRTSPKPSPDSVPSRHQNLADELSEFRGSDGSDTSSPDAPVKPDVKKEPETQSHSGSLNVLAGGPMGDEANDQNKETGQTQEPSPAGTRASKQTTQTSEENLPDARDVFKTEPSPPGPGWKGKERALSWDWERKPPVWIDDAPVFLMNDPEDEGLGAYQAPDAIREGEDTYQTIIRDQIRRCKQQLGDRWTEAAAQRIRDYYTEHCGIIRCPSEYSETASIHSPPTSPEAARSPPPVFVDDGPQSPPPRPDDGPYSPSDGFYSPANNPTNPISPRTQFTQAQIEYLRQAVKTLRQSVQILEESQPPSWLEAGLNDACTDIDNLQRRDKDAQKQIQPLTAEITTLKADIRALSGYTSGSIPPAAAAAAPAAARNLPQQGHQRYQGLPPPPRPPPVLLRASLFNTTAVCVALVVMVWLVLEAVLHSQRLSGGFGPFINGGYNGLASVLVFGTWKEFLWFVGLVVYVGLFAVRTALGW